MGIKDGDGSDVLQREGLSPTLEKPHMQRQELTGALKWVSLSTNKRAPVRTRNSPFGTHVFSYGHLFAGIFPPPRF